MSEQRTVWVLLRQQGDDATVHSVHANHLLMLARIEDIKAAPRQYPLERLSADCWRIGPTEDDVLSDALPVYRRAIEKPLTEDPS